MSRLDARKEVFTLAKVRGKEFLFSEMRIDRATLPEGWFLYEVREADEYSGEAAEISEGILVNFLGTLITDTPITEWDDERNNRHFIYLKYDDEPDFYETDDGVSDQEVPNSWPHLCPLESEWTVDYSELLTLGEYIKKKGA